MDDKKAFPQPSAIILEDQNDLSLGEICQACSVRVETMIELVDEGVLSPIGREPHLWLFTGAHLRRATVAIRLQRDLGVNMAGAALALQLLDELDALQAKLRKMGVI